MAELKRVKASVGKALLEGGMDTPEVLRLLQRLVATGHVYMQGGKEEEGGRVEGCVEEVLGNVAGYVVYVLRLFGLQSIGDASSSSYSSPVVATENLAGALVDFRARARAVALEDEQERSRRLRKTGKTDEEEEKKKEGSSSGELPLSQKLLRLCDDFRDGELARLGLQVEDLGAGKCHWTLEAPPPPPSSPAVPAAALAATPAPAVSPVGRQPQRAKASVALEELFKQGPYEGEFSSFDTLGIPTADAKGQPLSKTLRGKLEKKHARHAALLKEKGDDRRRE